MENEFPRMIRLLRSERGYSQKKAAEDLGVKQALLSHYEKGVRECGLSFLVKCANYYGVSCDYLLGRTPDRTGAVLSADDIPDIVDIRKESAYRGNILPTLNKKLISNSLIIIFDLLVKLNCTALIEQLSYFLMLSVYKAFRIIYLTNSKNPNGMFSVDARLAQRFADAAMAKCEARATAIARGGQLSEKDDTVKLNSLNINGELLSEGYPQIANSLMNVLKRSEELMK